MDFAANEFVLMIDGRPTRHADTGGPAGYGFMRMSPREIEEEIQEWSEKGGSSQQSAGKEW